MKETGGNPWGVVARTVRNIDYFLSAGNFRPLGRMLTDLAHAFYMETALAMGVAARQVLDLKDSLTTATPGAQNGRWLSHCGRRRYRRRGRASLSDAHGRPT